MTTEIKGARYRRGKIDGKPLLMPTDSPADLVGAGPEGTGCRRWGVEKEKEADEGRKRRAVSSVAVHPSPGSYVPQLQSGEDWEWLKNSKYSQFSQSGNV